MLVNDGSLPVAGCYPDGIAIQPLDRADRIIDNMATVEDCRQQCEADPTNCEIFAYATATSQPVSGRLKCYLWQSGNNDFKEPQNQNRFLTGVPIGCYDPADFGF